MKDKYIVFDNSMNIENISFDIIITTYNNPSILENLLNEINEQTLKNIHCIVIDDCPDDDHYKEIVKKYKLLYIKTKSNNGPAINRNYALNYVKSKYTLFLDDDISLTSYNTFQSINDLLRPDNIAQYAFKIVNYDDETMLTDCGIWNYNGLFHGGIFNGKYIHEVHGLDTYTRKVLGGCTAATFVNNNVIKNVGGFDGDLYYLGEDTDLSLKIINSGYDVVYRPDIIFKHMESMSMNKRFELKKYLYYRNNLIILFRNYPLKHILHIIFKMMFQNDSVKYGTGINTISKSDSWIRFKSYFGFIVRIPRIIFHKFKYLQKYNVNNSYNLYKLLKMELSNSTKFNHIIFEITNVCNARCAMCFVLDELNKKTNLLSLDEIDKMFCNMKELKSIVLGGGEPFLRKDIDKICGILHKYNPNISITIPTNASKPKMILEKLKLIKLIGCKNVLLSISIDGLPEYHDENRKIPGLSKKIIELYNLIELHSLDIRIQINSCITGDSFSQIDELYDYISVSMPNAEWIFEPVRGNYNKDDVTGLSIEQWMTLQSKIPVYKKSKRQRDLKRLFDNSINVLKNKKQIVPCTGGTEFISINYQGNLNVCENFEDNINIRDMDYNVNNLQKHERWNKRVNSVINNECYCTHFCWLGHSLNKWEPQSIYSRVLNKFENYYNSG